MITNRIEILIHIKTTIALILTELNLLGEYEVLERNVVVGTIPSIQIRYPMKQNMLNLRMKANSGYEVTVESEPRMNTRPTKFGHTMAMYYQVILDQYRESGGLSDGLLAIIGSNQFDIPESPIIREAVRSEEGITPPRAIIAIRRVNFMQNLTFA
jgi:hypothetical protein